MLAAAAPPLRAALAALAELVDRALTLPPSIVLLVLLALCAHLFIAQAQAQAQVQAREAALTAALAREAALTAALAREARRSEAALTAALAPLERGLQRVMASVPLALTDAMFVTLRGATFTLLDAEGHPACCAFFVTPCGLHLRPRTRWTSGCWAAGRVRAGQRARACTVARSSR